MWGVLTRNGGSEDVQSVPATIQLAEPECFFGRFEQPVKTPESKFTHSSQTVLNCLFVSSTHFSISVSNQGDSGAVYTIADFSRNGTYLDGALIGPNVQKTLSDGAVISLMYKNKPRVCYLFNTAKTIAEKQAVSASNSAVKQERVKQEHVPTPPVPREEEESARYASMKSQADSAADALARQIAVLQEESKRSEQRMQQLTSRVEASGAELDKANTKVAALEKQVDALQKDKEDLSERLTSSESNAAAVEARNCKLTEQIEDVRAEMKELRTKNTLLSEDLQAKTAQLESRNDLMQNSNKALAHENKKWAKLEKKYEDACEKIREAEDYSARVTTANQALQGITADHENTIARLHTKNRGLVELLAQGRAAVETREAEVLSMHQRLSAAAKALSDVLATNEPIVDKAGSYFDEISNQLVTSSLTATPPRDSQENTYAEGSFNKQRPHSPTNSQGGPPFSANTQASVFNRTPSGAGTKYGVHAGTGNGADTTSSYGQSAKRTGGVAVDADRDRDRDGVHGNLAMDIARSSSSSSNASEDSQALARASSLAGEKRKRDRVDGHGVDHEEGPAKMLVSAPRSGTRTNDAEHDGAAEDVGAEGQEQQDGAGDAAGDGAEDDDDLQRTQAQANFAHLFEDNSDGGASDDEAEEAAGLGVTTEAEKQLEGEDQNGGAMEVEAVSEPGASGPHSVSPELAAAGRAPSTDKSALAARASAEPIDLVDSDGDDGHHSKGNGNGSQRPAPVRAGSTVGAGVGVLVLDLSDVPVRGSQPQHLGKSADRSQSASAPHHSSSQQAEMEF